MGKVIVSPVAKWPGSVTLAEPMTFEQYLRWKQTITTASALIQDDKVPWDEYDATIAPGIVACVERFDLAGLPEHPATLPATPRVSSHRLVGWLLREISALITEDEEVPKA
jgi:hypothetical protein